MEEVVQTLAQAGGIGVGLSALFLVYKITLSQRQTMETILRDYSTSNKLVAEALTGNTEVIRSLRETIERKM